MFDYESAVKQLQKDMGVDFVGLALPSNLKSEQDVTWKYVCGNLNERYKRIHLRRGSGVAGVVMKTGRKWIDRDISKTDVGEYTYKFPIINFENLTSFFAVPLWKYNKVVAVLLFANRNHTPLTETIEADVEKLLETGFGPFYPEDVINFENTKG